GLRPTQSSSIFPSRREADPSTDDVNGLLRQNFKWSADIVSDKSSDPSKKRKWAADVDRTNSGRCEEGNEHDDRFVPRTRTENGYYLSAPRSGFANVRVMNGSSSKRVCVSIPTLPPSRPGQAENGSGDELE
ncbi:hypothetical protein GOP47_0023212, partial [Adiantum capillus-veneris]